MTPREIDALICEHIMGKTSVSGKYWHLARDYSTDPAASRLLREEMRAVGWSYSCHGHPGEPYGAQFWREGRVTRAEADTEEMAYALAALSARGIEVKP